MSEATPTFMARGLCTQMDPEAFYPERGGSNRKAKMVCHRCPVEFDCLTWALERHERYGIWGGTSPNEREDMLRAKRRFFRNMPLKINWPK